MKIAERIRMRREALNLKQYDVADEAGIPRSTYRGYESGHREIGVGALKKIAFSLKTTVAALLGETPVADTSSGISKTSELEALIIKELKTLQPEKQTKVLGAIYNIKTGHELVIKDSPYEYGETKRDYPSAAEDKKHYKI